MVTSLNSQGQRIFLAYFTTFGGESQTLFFDLDFRVDPI